MHQAIESLFTQHRSQNGYVDTPVPEATLRQLYELVKWGPSSGNSQPGRFAFVQSADAKARLVECMAPGNQQKVREAPVSVIVGMDMAFYDQLPRLLPAKPQMRDLFVGKPELIADTALRNSSLQGGYLILAARALGLGCGPMSGFDAAKVDAAFWAGTTVRTNFVCTLGEGDPSKLYPRNPRLTFEEACRLH